MKKHVRGKNSKDGGMTGGKEVLQLYGTYPILYYIINIFVTMTRINFLHFIFNFSSVSQNNPSCKL